MVLKMKRILSFFLVVLLPSLAYASDRGDVRLDGHMGFNQTYGLYGGAALSSSFDVCGFLEFDSSVRYSSFGRTALDIRPSWFMPLPSGRLSAGVLAHYVYQNHTDDFCFGAGAGLELRWFRADLGYYCRIMSAGGSSVTEPFNLYYEFAFSCLPDVENWDLHAILSNCRPAQLERLHQPCVALECIFYPSSSVGIVLSADYRRTGILHVSSMFYQFYGSLGVKFRW